MYKFLTTLSDFVRVGQIFVISGYSGRHAQNIRVLLSCGNAEDADAALSLDTRFGEQRIIRSALVGGNCINEESGSDIANLSYDNSMPLRPGEQFTFCILIGDDRFHIAVNDSPFCQYKFRVAPEQIRSLKIYGDIDALVKVNHLKMFPFIYPTILSDYEELAFEGYIPVNYKPGHLVVVSGNVNGKSDGEFIVIFTQDEKQRQLIHFNVRFDEMSIVMNAMDLEEGWCDNEIRTMDFPFRLGEKFKIAFAFTSTDLKVAVNGDLLINFSLSNIELAEGEDLWEQLTGFRVKNGVDMVTNIESVQHIHMNDENCNDFENYCSL